jgi:carboxymethylenebutenolidase
VVHENRGLQPHIRDVARRAATAGYVALAIGGTPATEDEARQKFAQMEPPVALADALKTIEYLRGRPDATGKVGVVGFCWGGSMVNQIAASGADIQAAVVFYGGSPPVERVPAIRAPLLMHYAGLDERVNATVPGFEAALKAAGKPYTLHMFEGVNHRSTTTRAAPATTPRRPGWPGRARSSSSTAPSGDPSGGDREARRPRGGPTARRGA